MFVFPFERRKFAIKAYHTLTGEGRVGMMVYAFIVNLRARVRACVPEIYLVKCRNAPYTVTANPKAASSWIIVIPPEETPAWW